MRLKLFLKNAIRPALLFSLFFSLFLCGCSDKIESTYKEKDIPYHVKKICKEEYGLEVTTQRSATTLWVYAPLEKILHKDYGVVKDKIFDEQMIEKLRNIITTTGRVLISSDNAPQFYGLVASDINLGLDYIIIGYVLDIKKSYAGFIPWPEANRRYVIQLRNSPKAIGDRSGFHIEAADIQLPEFLAKQIAQRIGAEFQDESMKKYFQVEKSEGVFREGTFHFEYSIKRTSQPDKDIDVRRKIIDIITYCLKSYEFEDFSEVQLADLETQGKLSLNRGAIWAEDSLH